MFLRQEEQEQQQEQQEQQKTTKLLLGPLSASCSRSTKYSLRRSTSSAQSSKVAGVENYR